MVNFIEIKDKGKSGNEYFAEMAADFPSLKDEIDFWEEEDIFNRMEEFARYTNMQITSGEIDELRRCLMFQEQRIDKVNQGLLNALDISYFETIYSENDLNTLKELKKLMPEKLKIFYKKHEKSYADNFGKREDEDT